MRGLNVRLRSVYDVPHDRQTLFEVPHDTDLEKVADTLRSWGISDEDGTDLTALIGQFRVGGNGPTHFEFVADTE